MTGPKRSPRLTPPPTSAPAPNDSEKLTLAVVAGVLTVVLVGLFLGVYFCIKRYIVKQNQAHTIRRDQHQARQLKGLADCDSACCWFTGENKMGNEEIPHKNLVLVVYIFTFVTGLPANILALCAFSRKVRQKPTPVDILLLNLTVSDLIFLMFLPFRIKEAADNMEWNMPYFLCPLSGFLFYTTIYNSTFFLTAVSVERYLCVAYPIKYKLMRRPVYAVVASVIFWVVASGHCSIVYIMQYFEHKNSSQIEPFERDTCYKVFTKEQLEVLLPVRLELFLVLFCIPFLICCFCYINFIRILSQLPNISLHKRQRAIGMAMGTLVVFILCFGPYNVSHVVGYATWLSPSWRVHALLFSTFNACLDPLIFYFSSSAVRSMLSQVLKGVMGRLHMTCCDRTVCCSYVACGRNEESTQCSNETT
ncbi:hypothetical protein AAFF_G00329200 [Aldrovandia affinis]|uniref:G-protein coupled receptors family 1 profile domain-containing protein n=1 Tax=Aldrovandia affinis TaxID=143900 RepID=A0AAD7WQU8_9TELE|nr:hypothetical protein AAFF_G00329200 [Aldrovandia affinis]